MKNKPKYKIILKKPATPATKRKVNPKKVA